MEKKFNERGRRSSDNFFMKDRRDSSGREARSERGTDNTNRRFSRENSGNSSSEKSSDKRDFKRPSHGDGNFGERRSFNPNFDNSNRVRKPYQDRSDRPSGSFAGRSESDREQRGFNKENRGDRNFSREGRPERNFSRDDKGERSFNRDNRGGRNFERGGTPERSFNRENRGDVNFNRDNRGERPYSRDSRPERSFNREDRGDRVFNRDNKRFDSNRTDSRQDRPDRGDRVNRGEDWKPFENRPRRSFGDNGGDSRFRSREESNTPQRERNSYGDRQERPFSRDKREGFGREQRFQKDDRREFKSDKKEEATTTTYEPKPLINRDIRLNRYIAMSGICSRREADMYIETGVVSVNDVVVTELGTKVTSADVIKFNGEVIRGEKKVYVVMNKPKGFVTTIDDSNAEHIVMDLIGDKVKERIYPVGRLDKNTIGVLLLTNDGELTKELTHPSYNKKKIYHVILDKSFKEEDMSILAEGIELEDGIAFADEISHISSDLKEVGLEIHNGRNRIVRRMFEHLGYKIQKLDRVYFAGLTKKGLQRGHWRHLTPREVSTLKGGSYQ